MGKFKKECDRTDDKEETAGQQESLPQTELASQAERI